MSVTLPFTASLPSLVVDNGGLGKAPGDDRNAIGSRLECVFLVSLGLMVMLASVIFAASEGGPIPAVAGAMAPFALYFVDRRRWLTLPNFWAGLLGLVGLVATIVEFFSGDIESRLLSGGHFMCYLTWIVLWQHKALRQYWMLSALSILQVAVGALLTNSPWLGVGLIAYIAVSLWTLCVFSMYRLEAVSDDPQARRLRDPKLPLWYPIESPVVRPQLRFHDPSMRVTPRFIGISVTVIVASVAFAAVAFLMVPRVWVGQFQIFDNSPLPGARPLTGFTNEVRLGDLGQILENSDPVMEVEFFDNVSSQRLTLNEAFALLGTPEPLFRGAVLEEYEEGRWKSGGNAFDAPSRRPSSRDFLRQEIKLHPMGMNTIFTTGNPVSCIGRQPAETLFFNRQDRTFLRDSNANLQAALLYSAYSRPSDSVEADPPSRLSDTLQIPRGLQELVSVTRERIDQTEGLTSDRETAEFLERWLRDSGEFSYTLSLSVSDPTVDPVHDFFFNRKTGHCEYFAATLTMMLRSAGIHARMVSGFKGGVADRTNDVLKIQQLHAHAWVEAWLDGAWLQLDPTPAGRSESVAAIESNRTWKRWMTQFQRLWGDGLTWSKADQDELIYDPFNKSLSSAWESFKSPAVGMQRFMASVREFLADPSKWFSWQGGMAVFVISMFSIGIWKLTNFFWRLIQRQREMSAARDAARVSVPFYARFEALLEKLSLVRAPAETPLEFASQAQGRFKSMSDTNPWPTELPDEIARHFYTIRFGGEPLDEGILQRIECDLDQLEERIRNVGATK